MDINMVLKRTGKTVSCLLLGLLTNGAIIGQDTLEDTGLLATEINKTAPTLTDHWGQLVGNWDIEVEIVNSSGEITQSFNGEWNWFYVMNGMAIQDVFILPKREDAKDQNSFYGIGLRIYNEKLNKWQTAYMDTSNKQMDTGEAISTNEKIILIETNEKDEKIRITYFDFQDNTFKWQQEVFNEDRKVWQINQLIHATRKS
ncbi:hypothetical protein [Flagellimonas sp. W118]|uniref:hypothetical protein n=1 Tax=Flagellimonas sp. W118 TaxID=3410791 RepID=UPI003BF4F086